MRFHNYLIEKFIDAVKIYGHTYEIFKNPTKKELRELENGNGFRFIIDAKKKNIYFANADIFHRDMLKSPEISSETGFGYSRWGKYWGGKDEAISYIFMGDCESDMDMVNSDVLSDFVSERRTEVISKLDVLLNYDYSWVSKYGIDPSDIKKEISNTIELLEERL